jgi:hypothetical protein
MLLRQHLSYSNKYFKLEIHNPKIRKELRKNLIGLLTVGLLTDGRTVAELLLTCCTPATRRSAIGDLAFGLWLMADGDGV